MIERVVENWLTKVNERSMETPFCQLLTGEGYRVIHLSRHGPFEQGKDILAIDPNGTPCAFQLKGAPASGRITQTAWANEYLAQATRLVELPIKHPSVDPNQPRRAFFVTNGELDEEVRIEIIDRNADWQRRGHPTLETIVKGELLRRFIDLHTNLWPLPLASERDLLELFLADGTAILPKAKLAGLLERLLLSHEENVAKAVLARTLASVAIVTSYAISPYQDSQNHVAVFEGWTMYVAYLAALVEKLGLEEQYWRDSLSIAAYAIEQALTDLASELRERQFLVEGDLLVDQPFYRGRITWLVGLMSTLALWHILRQHESEEDGLKDWLKNFVTTYRRDMSLWGEGAIPSFLALFWFLQKSTGTRDPDELLSQILDNVVDANGDNRRLPFGLPDPYRSLPEIVELQYNLRTSSTPPTTFHGRSYTMETLIHLLARRLWRQKLALRWAAISKLTLVEFQPENSYEFCRWHTESGKNRQTLPSTPQSWQELRDRSREVDMTIIPKLFQGRPELLLAFLQVYPHRLSKDVAKHLDNCILGGQV